MDIANNSDNFLSFDIASYSSIFHIGILVKQGFRHFLFLCGHLDITITHLILILGLISFDI